MADSPSENADNFVEIDGAKYKEDPEKEGEALIGEDGELVPFEEKPEETEEEKEAREKKEKEDRKAEEDEQPPTRRSAKDHIIQRQQKKIKKLKGESDGEGDEGGEGGEEVTPEGRTAIQKEVEKGLTPMREIVRTQSDEQELKDVFAKYPDAKKIEERIRKYMGAEGYEKTPVEFIYLGLAAKEMKLQEKRNKADEDAKGGKTGGHGKRKKSLSPIPDVRDMPGKEFDALVNKVKRGQFSVE